MYVRIGWTGTRSLDDKGRAYVDRVLRRLNRKRFGKRAIIITGGCIGTDAYVAERAMDLGLWVHTILPANRSQVDPQWRNHCDTYEEMPDHTDYRARNERIIEQSDYLHAVADYPEKYRRSLLSGTWMTIRIARVQNMDVFGFIQNGKW